MMFKILNGMAPAYMEDLFKQETGLNVYNLRASHKNIALPKTRTDYYRKIFAFTGAKLWRSVLLKSSKLSSRMSISPSKCNN